MTLSLTPRLILAELQKRGVEARQVESKSPVTYLEYADKLGRVRFINGTVTDKTSAVACRIADNKLMTAAIAERVGVPVPATVVAYDALDEANAFLAQHKKVVVKPVDSAHGNGVTVGVDTPEKLTKAVELAKQFSRTIIVQQQVNGRDIRLLYIGGELAAASQRKPASVIGDGQHSIQELIALINQDPERGDGYEKKYTRIPEQVAEAFLGARYADVPAQGEEVQVIGTANIGSGGTAIDVTDEMPQQMIDCGKKLVAELRMGVCGVDFIQDGDNFYLIEVNASPSFGLHVYPHQGKSRDVATVFVDWLLSDNAN